MKHIRAIAFVLGLLPAIAAAQVPNYPQTMPANTIVGRLGIGPGPSQAIPFSVLASQLSNFGNFVIGPASVTPGDAVIFGATPNILLDAGAAPVLTTRTISTTAPLAGGGALSANRTLSLNLGTGLNSTGGNLNIANTITAGGPIGSATVTPIVTFNAQGQLTIVSQATIAPPFTAVTGSLGCAQLPSLTGDVTNTNCATVIGANKVGNSQIAQASAATFKGNPTGSTANVSDFTIQGLTARGAPDATNDKIPLYDNAAGTIKYVTPGAIASSATAGVSSIAANTGAFTLSTGITNSTNDIQLDKASGSNLRAGTSNKALTADNIFDAEQTITYAASQTFDFSAFLNARVTLTGNITSLTCSNIKASQSGTITLVQDGTGSRAMVAAWCSQFRWSGGTRGVLSTAASAIDALFYQCISTSICYVSLGKAQAN